jgi:RNA polymerase sigma-70 factor, ECF subfamily
MRICATNRQKQLLFIRKVPANHRLFIEDINGAPALLSWSKSQLNWVLTLDIFDNSIEGLRSILNPDKLAFLQRQLERRQKQQQPDVLE